MRGRRASLTYRARRMARARGLVPRGGSMSTGLHQGDGTATGSVPGATVRPLLPIGGGPLPSDTPPSVIIRPRAGAVVAGQPVAVSVFADEGQHWFRDGNGDPDSRAIVDYSATTLTLDGGDGGCLRPGRWRDLLRGVRRAGRPCPGRHRQHHPGARRRVPADGRPGTGLRTSGVHRGLTEGSGHGGPERGRRFGDRPADVLAGQFFPLTVDVIHDGVTSSGTGHGGQLPDERDSGADAAERAADDSSGSPTGMGRHPPRSERSPAGMWLPRTWWWSIRRRRRT